ncbi:hypothetical protein GCM10027048_35840 [Hymenobacter coalescens]
MKLTASPFDPVTGALLPVYRDAYLRGDLSKLNTGAVDAYLRKRNASADETLRRFYELQQQGERVRPVGWVRRQFELIRTEPRRLRHRVGALVAGAALVGGAVLAGTGSPMAPAEVSAEAFAGESSVTRLSTVRGRILDENGRPLIGATVLVKGSTRGVSTNADGEYALLVPAGRSTTLAYGYGGYQNENVAVYGGRTENVTLLPRPAERPAGKTKRWFLF